MSQIDSANNGDVYDFYKMLNRKMNYVYFIKKGKFVKIGTSTNPEQRLRTLQTGTNQKLELIYKTWYLNEKDVHTKFERYRDHNEWFYLSKELKNFIEANSGGSYEYSGLHPRKEGEFKW